MDKVRCKSACGEQVCRWVMWVGGACTYFNGGGGGSAQDVKKTKEGALMK